MWSNKLNGRVGVTEKKKVRGGEIGKMVDFLSVSCFGLHNIVSPCHSQYLLKLIQWNYAACDDTFFPSLQEEMSAILGCFNARAQELLKLHLASGIGKLIFWFKGKLKGSGTALAEEGRDLVIYALVNATAIRKILKKYDKVSLSCFTR